MIKSASESHLNEHETDYNYDKSVTPPNFVYGRAKKRKEYDSPSSKGQHTSGNNDLNTLREDIKDMFTSMLAAQKQEFNKINPTLKLIQETNNKIESSIDFLTKQNGFSEKN
ncbi:unnamed protein product [Diatraea saccharalis]|uniref:Uncharacterized protein n=1 Tax=Diatraea saccharalis TaxID=40085 RepID=A0A9N9WG34_9NEOP|nr:unnamed protein product [Diatraea saccharalis]